jgi:RNA polymerase sigma-70 factor (ECF subfamily)
MTNSENESDFTDKTLVRRLKGGEEDAATALYVRYAKRLQRLASYQTSDELAFQVSSDEIVQTVFRTFFRRAAQGQYAVAEGDDLWKLLLVIALNKIRKLSEYHQAQKRDMKRTNTFESKFFETQLQHDGDQDVSHSVLKLTVDEMLAGLPATHQQIVHLRIEGNSLPEIALKAGSSKRTAERVLQAFRKQLLELVEVD